MGQFSSPRSNPFGQGHTRARIKEWGRHGEGGSATAAGVLADVLLTGDGPSSKWCKTRPAHITLPAPCRRAQADTTVGLVRPAGQANQWADDQGPIDLIALFEDAELLFRMLARESVFGFGHRLHGFGPSTWTNM